MEDMWRSRAKPTPLDFDAIQTGTFELPTKPAHQSNGAGASATSNRVSNGSSSGPPGSAATESLLNGRPSNSSASLKDQRALTLQDNLKLFVVRYVVGRNHHYSLAYIWCSAQRLSFRLRNGEETISFDKDDDDTLDFVTAAANLRSAAYGIPGKSRWEVKGKRASHFPRFSI